MYEKVIDIHNVSKTFGGAKALKNVDFSLNRGEVHCLIGQNGSGKSTLIKIIAGVLRQDSGEKISIDGVSVIYQDLSLFPNLTVGENIWFPLYRDSKVGLNKTQLKKKALEALQRLKVDMDLNKRVEKLSVADRQLVAIARAIVSKSEIIIMDEPTSSLTVREVSSLFEVIDRLKKDNVSVIFVSHKLDEIVEIADRITVIRDGSIIKSLNASEADEDELSYLISGQKINFSRKTRDIKNENILETISLSRAGEFEDISFSLRKGEVLGIAGQLGSGRTELALCLFGLTKRDSGSVILGGEQVDFKKCRNAIDAGIAYVPEDRILQGVAIEQSVGDNLAAAVLKKFRNGIGLLSQSKADSCVNDWIGRFGIKSAHPQMKVSGLSGGNQQKVVLAKWLETEPRVLILDQPTNGIDVGAKTAIYQIIAQLADSGMSVILISDEPQELYLNCDRVIVMQRGKLVSRIEPSKMSLQEFREEVKHEEQPV